MALDSIKVNNSVIINVDDLVLENDNLVKNKAISKELFINNDSIFDIKQTNKISSDLSIYNQSAALTNSYFSNYTIPANATVTSLTIAVTELSQAPFVCLLNSAHRVVYTKSFSLNQINHLTTIDINYTTTEIVNFVVWGPILYGIGLSLSDDYRFNNGGLDLIQGLTSPPEVGLTLTVYHELNTNFYFAFNFTYKVFLYDTKISKIDYSLYYIKTALSNSEIAKFNYVTPIYDNYSTYSSIAIIDRAFVGNKIIPAYSLITSLNIISAVYDSGWFAFLGENSDTVLYAQRYSISDANVLTSIPVYFNPTINVRLVIHGLFKYTTNDVQEPYVFNTTGLDICYNQTIPSVGESLNIIHEHDNFYAFGVQIVYATLDENISPSPQTIDISSQINLSRRFEAYGSLINKYMPQYVELNTELGFIGRWYKKTVNNKECYVSNTSGSEFYFKTNRASTVNINFEPMTNSGAYYVVSIDGGTESRKSIDTPYVDLPDTNTHIVRVTLDGIAESIGKWENGTGYALYNVVPNSGNIMGILPKDPMIIYFGDSITEGISSLGSGATSSVNSATASFPWFCSKKMGVVALKAGYGATGILRTGFFNTAINAILYLYNGVPIPTYYPNLIVVNFGTNDLSASNFASEYQKYLDVMKIMYPGVRAFIMIPLNQSHASEIRSVVANNDWCTLVETSDWEGITYSDGLHPTKAGAEIIGNYLADFIMSELYQ